MESCKRRSGRSSSRAEQQTDTSKKGFRCNRTHPIQQQAYDIMCNVCNKPKLSSIACKYAFYNNNKIGSIQSEKCESITDSKESPFIGSLFCNNITKIAYYKLSSFSKVEKGWYEVILMNNKYNLEVKLDSDAHCAILFNKIIAVCEKGPKSKS